MNKTTTLATGAAVLAAATYVALSPTTPYDVTYVLTSDTVLCLALAPETELDATVISTHGTIPRPCDYDRCELPMGHCLDQPTLGGWVATWSRPRLGHCPVDSETCQCVGDCETRTVSDGEGTEITEVTGFVKNRRSPYWGVCLGDACTCVVEPCVADVPETIPSATQTWQDYFCRQHPGHARCHD